MFGNLCQRLLVGRQHPALCENRVLRWNLFTHRGKFINHEKDSHSFFVLFKIIFTNSFKFSTSLLPVLTPSGSAGSLPAPKISSSLALEKGGSENTLEGTFAGRLLYQSIASIPYCVTVLQTSQDFNG